jgi:hypothetical protein
MSAKPGVYMPTGASGYELCHPQDKADFHRITELINGTPRSDGWVPLVMHLIKRDEGKSLLSSDSPWLGLHAPIFRSSALEVMGLDLKKHGELLPLICPGAELWIFNTTTVLDALDEASSSVMSLDCGQILTILRHEFRPEVIADIDVFKLPSEIDSSTYVSHRFVNRWKGHRLKGLDFRHVWTAPSP